MTEAGFLDGEEGGDQDGGGYRTLKSPWAERFGHTLEVNREEQCCLLV